VFSGQLSFGRAAREAFRRGRAAVQSPQLDALVFRELEKRAAESGHTAIRWRVGSKQTFFCVIVCSYVFLWL